VVLSEVNAHGMLDNKGYRLYSVRWLSDK